METCVKQAREEYQNWYQNQAGRAKVYFEPEQPETAQGLPLPERIRKARQGGEDTGLWNLYLGFARHLLIGSSQKGGFPSNLQGIWSEEIQPPWNGDWHLNAQQQLYWLAERIGLPENHEPFLELTRQLVEPWKKTAQAYYRARGWVVHTMTNPWNVTSPMEDAFRTSTANNLMNLAFHCNERKLHHEEPEIGIVPYQFQMDGNEAIAMAMLLMLLAEDVFISEDGAMQIHLYLLPALPSRLPGGGAWAIKSLEDV